MSSTYPARASFVPARAWHNLAEDVLNDADGYYKKVEERAEQKLAEEQGRRPDFRWPWEKPKETR